MPEIKQYTRQVQSTGLQRTGDTRGAFGGQMGEDLQRAGQQLEQYATKRAKSDYITKMSAFQLENMRAQEELSNQDFAPDADLSLIYQQNLEQRASQLNISPLVGDLWERDLAQMKMGFAKSGMSEGVRRESVRVKEGWEDTLTNLSNNVALGGSVEEAIAVMREAGNNLPSMASEDRDAIMGDAEDTIRSSGAQAFVSSNPYEFKRMAKAGEFNDLKDLSKYMRAADAEIKSRDAEAKRAQAGVREQAKSFESALTMGFDVPKEQWDVTYKAARQTGDAKLVSYMDGLKANKDIVNTLRKMPPDDLQSYINSDILPAMRKDGASRQEVMLFDMTSAMLKESKKEIDADPMSWAARNGVAVPELDIANPDSLRARMNIARTNADTYSIDVKPLTDEEATATTNEINKANTQEQMQMLNQIRATGSDANYMFRQIGETDDVLAHAGGLLSSTSNPAPVKAVLMGKKSLEENPTFVPNSADVEEAYNGYIGDSFSNTPKNALAVKKSALAHYIGSGKFDGSLFVKSDFEDSISAVLGAKDGDNPIYKSRGGVSTVLPVGSNRREFKDFLGEANNETYKLFSVGGGAPMYKDKVVPPSYFKSLGDFEMIESGVYRVRINGYPVIDAETGSEYRMMLDESAIKLIGGNK